MSTRSWELQGVIVRGIRDLGAMAPPFVVTHAELQRMFALLTRALDRMWGGEVAKS